MKQLFIPELGTSFTLAADWSFDLHAEYRNEKLGEYFNLCANIPRNYRNLWIDKNGNFTIKYYESKHSYSITLPKETVLTIDRIYIRKGQKTFSSVSFFCKLPNVKKRMRFWAKLEDVNKIVYL